MSSSVAIKVEHASKCYEIYEHPRDRLKQLAMPRLQRYLGGTPNRYFREFWALKDVSLEVQRGETVGIIGRNGSGKSTLLQLICGTLNPTSGKVETNGRISALLELGSGFNPEFTGRENVYMNATVLGLSTNEINARFDEIAAFADIGAFIEQPVKSYSSGMMVRLAFAVAINVEPEILIVDEALSVGDELFQRKCFSKIEAIRARGATILFVSHSASQIVELCDRAILMDQGEKLAAGIPKQIVGSYQKLLYAPEQTRATIREEICRTNSHEPNAVASDRTEAIVARHDDGARESFDPHLKPASTIDYESHGARIVDPRVTTIGGDQINNLIMGRTYRYSYTVVFDKPATRVRFGMMIKTTAGVELGGCASASSPRTALAQVEPGQIYTVEFNFRCSLNPGVYFLNAGVIGDVHGSDLYLHRLVDIAMFRVATERDNLATGIVDFECRAEVLLDKTYA
ncbi:ABC-type polysaccharide/polyol phosphate transport system, ATPase component [Rhizobium sp. CF122]|uniref:ABC transporter ATP-binding protein n=1 Tax=Rhizobium sp. CF122 TaxID=1144312 RepID=UPI00027185FB|nr:ABC transporter ATP-binding protein [Rhizobium sp. CF122]EJL58062.1 ABC-type polysaccharide/polyol phosphate transport system, ATPase component [Rhizobium sp. CF122]